MLQDAVGFVIATFVVVFIGYVCCGICYMLLPNNKNDSLIKRYKDFRADEYHEFENGFSTFAFILIGSGIVLYTFY